jgi:DNA polymerase/3'-5' exonuclease PolX
VTRVPSMKRNLDPKVARKVAADFLRGTRDLYERCELAGSLRRKEPVVHDIDFAVIPKGRDFAKWKERMTERVVEIGGVVISFGAVISDFYYRGAQVNLFLCSGREAWGVTLMWATGPKGHTIGMTIKARGKGLLINSRGIWTREEHPHLVPARTEQEVGRILDWKYKPPEKRGKDTKGRPSYY